MSDATLRGGVGIHPLARQAAVADARRMETTRDDAAPGTVSDPPPKDRPERPQHDLLRKDLPENAVGAALDDFDGDEN